MVDRLVKMDCVRVEILAEHLRVAMQEAKSRCTHALQGRMQALHLMLQCYPHQAGRIACLTMSAKSKGKPERLQNEGLRPLPVGIPMMTREESWGARWSVQP